LPKRLTIVIPVLTHIAGQRPYITKEAIEELDRFSDRFADWSWNHEGF